MNDLNEDTNRLFSDFLRLLGHYLSIGWNTLMRFTMFVGLMPLFKKFPKLLILLIVVLMCVTPPISFIWAGFGFMALLREASADNNFIIELNNEKVANDAENEAEVFRDELVIKLYEQGVENPVEAAKKITVAQYGKPIEELIN